jgi:ribosomal protein L29
MAEKTKQRLATLRAMSEADMDAAIEAAHKRIYQFRKDRLSKPQEDTMVVRNARKEIARILTVRRQRELSQGNGG